MLHFGCAFGNGSSDSAWGHFPGPLDSATGLIRGTGISWIWQSQESPACLDVLKFWPSWCWGVLSPWPRSGLAGRDVQPGAGSGCILPASRMVDWVWKLQTVGQLGLMETWEHPSCPVTPPHQLKWGCYSSPASLPQDIPSATAPHHHPAEDGAGTVHEPKLPLLFGLFILFGLIMPRKSL